MNLTSVIVDGVGKFGIRSEIAGFGPGVNILAAGNEAGKSILFKAIRACLFERHNTRNELVRKLASDGVSLPVTIELGFEHDGHTYTVTKSFIKSPSASLMRGATVIARNREADEMIWELLGIGSANTRSVDEAAFGILWVGQGQSFQAPEPSEAATTALNSAIQAEVGALVGGERARAVLAALREELAFLVTDSGRPKMGGKLAAAISRFDAAASDLADTERRLAILDGQLVDLAAKRNERERLGDPALLSKMAADFATAGQDFKAGEAANALLAQFEAAEQRGKAMLDRVEQSLAALKDRRARIDINRQRSLELADALKPIDSQSNIARAAAQSARDEIAALDLQAEKNEEQERNLQRLAKCIDRFAGRPSLLRRQQAMEELEKRLVTHAAALAGNRATAAVMTSFDKIERELTVLIARLEASAPEVAIAVKAAGAGKVLLGEAPLTGTVVRAAVDPVTIHIGDLATITVTAPAAASSGDLKKRSQLQAQLSKLLEDAGAANGADLRIAGARRRELEAETAGLRAELGALGISDASPAPAIAKLKTEIAEIDAIMGEELARMQIEELPTADEVASRQGVLRQKREDARRKRQAFDGAIEAQNAILSERAGARGRLTGTLAEVEKSLNEDLAILPDADRTRIIENAETAAGEARNDYGIKAAALEEQRQKAPSQEELERRKLRVDRLERSLEGQKQRLGSLEKEIANLEGQIQNAGGDGLGEKAEIMREERDLAARDVERHTARVAAMTLLKETVEACYKDQRERLHAPLRRHLQPFMNDLFPSAELELGDGFSISGIKRAGPAPETFDRLSTGTQEQIAVLVRLAMGAMICERGQPVPIILDDALVFSDDDRIEQMFDALTRAGQKQQVIVLTCRTRAFTALGGRQLSIVSK